MKRRSFLKSSALLATASTVTGLNVARGAQAKGDDVIKVALVGCGNRGMGAIRQRLDVGDNMKLVAIGDAIEEKGKLAYGALQDMKSIYKDKIALTPETVFSGFDAYKKAIDSCDQILLVTTPGFRPIQYRYAVEKGKHIFLEKPCCVDAPGYRQLLEANKIADEKGLCVVVGLQRHYEQRYLEWMKKYQDGLMGDIVCSRTYWNGSNIWERPRLENDTELKFQMRNWYHFVWISGDNIVEQHVHNIDVANWVHGKGDPNFHPIKAIGMGGRQVRAFPRFRNSGYRWDHFTIEYTYPDGTKMFSQSRHQGNCWNMVNEEFEGTKGYGVIGQMKDGGWIKERGSNNLLWKFDPSKQKLPQPFQQEHNELVRFIREGIKHNDAWYAANSSFTGVLGRMAAYSGQEITWDDAVARGKAEFPEKEITSISDNPPVMPDTDPPIMPAEDDLLYENSSALPGYWKWYK
ncbi:MAG: Gfo/Idh/MocA family oxidoreductase [Thermoguttaceae bacterium]|nr:Gfo/Idh/MocA family oxidoreductase [Thermoguttaceae bacterium]